MKALHTLLLTLASLALSAQAGDSKKMVIENPCNFLDVKRPISNPTLFDTALPLTKIHAIFINQDLADNVDTILGKLPLGGDLQVYAVQAEFALNERLSIVATKDGYIDFRPDATLRETSGWANIAGGAKWAWLYRPEQGLASSLQLLYEFPSGDSDVWQGTGNGTIIPSILFLKACNRVQYSNVLGFRLPVDENDNSTQFFTSHHLGFHLTDWLYPMVEVNWFHVMDEGNGGPRFGALNAGIHDDLVTMAVGCRIAVPKLTNTDVGVAWEFPLTDDETTIMKDRLTVDLEIKF